MNDINNAEYISLLEKSEEELSNLFTEQVKKVLASPEKQEVSTLNLLTKVLSVKGIHAGNLYSAVRAQMT